MKAIKSLALGAAAAVTISGAAMAGATYDAIKAKGFIQCGFGDGSVAGFSLVDQNGNWAGIDVDACRAAAAAVFGDATKYKATALTTQQRFTALQSGEIDMLARNTTWTASRDTSLGLNFVGVNYYDGQGFMVAKSLGVSSAAELDGATVCVQPGTTTEKNLADYFRAKGMSFETVVIEQRAEVEKAFYDGRCDVYTTDQSGLASSRKTVAPNPDDYVILPEVISKEPLGPVVKHGDDEWFDIAKWSLVAMVAAEELGITSDNVDDMLANSTDPNVQRLLGKIDAVGEGLGLPNDWAYQIIKQVGNYGQSYKRNITDLLGVSRGVNELWTKGGIMYVPPVR